jgi:hypothetical protein
MTGSLAIEATQYQFDDGYLSLFSASDLIATFAPGHWGSIRLAPLASVAATESEAA